MQPQGWNNNCRRNYRHAHQCDGPLMWSVMIFRNFSKGINSGAMIQKCAIELITVHTRLTVFNRQHPHRRPRPIECKQITTDRCIEIRDTVLINISSQSLCTNSHYKEVTSLWYYVTAIRPTQTTNLVLQFTQFFLIVLLLCTKRVVRPGNRQRHSPCDAPGGHDVVHLAVTRGRSRYDSLILILICSMQNWCL